MTAKKPTIEVSANALSTFLNAIIATVGDESVRLHVGGGKLNVIAVDRANVSMAAIECEATTNAKAVIGIEPKILKRATSFVGPLETIKICIDGKKLKLKYGRSSSECELNLWRFTQ